MNSITHLWPFIIYLLSKFIQILPLPQDLVLVPMDDNSVSCYDNKADELNLL